MYAHTHTMTMDSCIDLTEDNEYETSRKKTKTGRVTCVLCGGIKKAAGKCPGEHYLCSSCTKQYVEKTLMSKGIVYWDRIPCLSQECYSKYMLSSSVQNVLSKKTKGIIDKQQMDTAHNIVEGVRDESSEKVVSKFCKPCPNCNVPIMKNGGCSHIVCFACGKDFFWDCSCNYPFHGENCEKEYPMARVQNN